MAEPDPVSWIPSSFSEEETRKGDIYFLEASGHGHYCNIETLFTESERWNTLRNSRLIILPLPDGLRPSGLREDFEKERVRVLTDTQKMPYQPPNPRVPPPKPQVPAPEPGLHNPSIEYIPMTPGRIPFYELPETYRKILQAVCPHCCLLPSILWRNVQQVQSRYESRFRTWKKKNEARACFLQFHTMQAPVLVDSQLTLALVHHICISNDPEDECKPFDEQHHEEKIFALMYVKQKDDETGEVTQKRTTEIIKQHLLRDMRLFQEERPEYSDPPGTAGYRGVDCSGGSIGLTPMLFMGVLLKWYGFKAAHIVVRSFEDLLQIDEQLIALEAGIRYGKIEEKSQQCNKLNRRLAELNKDLIGLRSRVNYVADSAQSMVTTTCTMTKYVTEELNRGDYDCIRSRKSLKRALTLLDSSRFVMRDNDKFDLIARAMQQYQVDIKSLKSHMTINIGLVSNHYSQLLAEAAVRDSSMVLVLTVIGVILLPFTFAAILLTGPMFDFTVPKTDWINVSNKLAWKIWGVISAVVYFVFGLIFLEILVFRKCERIREERDAKEKKEKEEEERKKEAAITPSPEAAARMLGKAVEGSSDDNRNGHPLEQVEIV
ncbi:hypothetical protein N431DRAFT_457792 [Stipitochalara longipes BDJ]|nr:hypothetical protein N431DRAFT_457792 [Stipitochalara longipes BDJ]